MVTFGKVMRSVVLLAVMGVSANAAPGIVLTKHNLSGTSTTSGIKSSDGTSGDVCVYCHTPHGSNTGFAGAPIWNKANMDTAAFTLYNGGTTVAGGTTIDQPGDVSKACLSCHDGVSAINSVINAPGSGQWVDISGGATTADLRAFLYPTGQSKAAGTILNMATATTNGVSNIGKDLRNDHPIGVIYTPGTAGLKVTTSMIGTVTIASVLRSNKVECSTCHDPHETNAMFLRTANTNSALCTSCHDR
ncbi:cytochrome c3 family protein [Sulfuricurvum sp.]|uniref:cytochrome c3 family protein n=1 Tax=Sulfuricurvum sp. TaxID=2025608 RepID=UPI00261B4379|nr:cytochrome c3 family protein [Sulfuricurvum sp.]MDD2780051.1 cytochrome c3 family protein [Sulfuricurvum sp.]